MDTRQQSPQCLDLAGRKGDALAADAAMQQVLWSGPRSRKYFFRKMHKLPGQVETSSLRAVSLNRHALGLSRIIAIVHGEADGRKALCIPLNTIAFKRLLPVY